LAVYSIFALLEWIVVASNIFFHCSALLDLRQHSLIIGLSDLVQKKK
jgi:hypothetical protein